MKQLSNYVELLSQRINNGIGSLFENMLPESMIQQILAEEGISYRNRLYTPIITLWIWLHQVLDKDKSCKNAVSRVVSSLSAHTPPSANTGAYCKARERIAEILVVRLLHTLIVFTAKHHGSHHLHDLLIRTEEILLLANTDILIQKLVYSP